MRPPIIFPGAVRFTSTVLLQVDTYHDYSSLIWRVGVSRSGRIPVPGGKILDSDWPSFSKRLKTNIFTPHQALLSWVFLLPSLDARLYERTRSFSFSLRDAAWWLMTFQIPHPVQLSIYSSPRWPALTSSFRGPSGSLVLLLLLHTSSRTRGLQLLPTSLLTQGPAAATWDGGRPTTACLGRISSHTRSITMCDMQMKSSGTGKADDGVGVVPGSSPPSVAVIGAGAAGLAAGRVLRDEGLRVTILEKSHHVGGVWRYKPEPEARAPMCES